MTNMINYGRLSTTRKHRMSVTFSYIITIQVKYLHVETIRKSKVIFWICN